MRHGNADPGDWPIRVCTAELRAHRALFYLVLVPLLGFWLPFLMFRLGTAVSVMAAMNSLHEQPNSDLSDANWVIAVSVAVPLSAFLVGAALELRRIHHLDRLARASSIPLPPRQGKQLQDIVSGMWATLPGRQRQAPRLLMQGSEGLTAHAYDDEEGQAIEVSVGIGRSALRGVGLALSVLRHELAHLAHRDLPAVRREAAVVGASILATRAAALACAVALLGLMLVADLVKFPVEATLSNILSVHAALVLAAALVTLPLLLSAYLLRRYSGFLVALVETRADASAGLWGQGLEAFSREVEADPTVRFADARGVGLSYLSPSLKHLPTQDRVALLRQPERLATPKLRYFAVAVLAVWLLTFHQGEAGWDAALLAATVALLQAAAVRMAMASSGEVWLPPWQAARLAAGLLAFQALPLISVEGLAYLAQHLTAAIVSPGGFGTAEGADYFKDCVDVLREFFGRVLAATGGPWFLAAIGLSAASLAVLFRLARRHPIGSVAGPAIAAVASVAVSYRFFQEALYWPVLTAALHWSPSEDEASLSWLEAAASAAQGAFGRGLWYFSEYLHGPPFLGQVPWLRLALPQLVAVAACALLQVSSRFRRRQLR